MNLDLSSPSVLNADDGRLMMATLSELVDVIAEAEGMDSATVALIARYAREAGFIQKKGRGPSAAQMGVTDAANLLIAANASRAARDAAVVIPLYRNLIRFEYVQAPEKVIPKDYVFFGDVLEMVIQSAIDGKLPETFRPQNLSPNVSEAFQEGVVSLLIGFRTSVLQGKIVIGEHVREKDVTSVSGAIYFPFAPRMTKENKLLYQKLRAGDRSDETEIRDRTIFSVAKALGSSQ